MLSSIIPTNPRPERSPDTCHQAWPSLRMYTIETTARTAIKLPMNNMGMERGRMRKEPDYPCDSPLGSTSKTLGPTSLGGDSE